MKILISGMSLLLCLLSTSLYAEQKEQEFDWKNVEKGEFDFAYVNPETDISKYSSVYIKAPVVSFDEEWLRRFGEGATQSYRERIKKKYGENLKIELGKYFEKNTRYKVVDKKGADTLIVIPKIVNLDIKTPDIAGIKETIVKFSGYAVVDLTVYSPKDKAVAALIVDRRNTPPLTSAEALMKIRKSNQRSYKKLFSKWSDKITEFLNQKA